MHSGILLQAVSCSSRYLLGMVLPTRSAAVISVSAGLTNRPDVELIEEEDGREVVGPWWGVWGIHVSVR